MNTLKFGKNHVHQSARTSHRRGARWIAVLAVLGFLNACAAQGDVDLGEGASPGGNCNEHEDCPSGQECRLNMCSAPRSEASTLNFRFIPPGEADYLPQFRTNVELQPQEPTNFVLRPPLVIRSGETNTPDAEVEGIRYADSSLKGPDGTLLFRPINAQSSLFIRETSVDRGAFHTQVNPGTYSLSFIPNDRELLPKKSWEPREFTRNTILSRTLLAPGNYTEIQGALVQHVFTPGSEPGREQHVAGAQVYAISTDGQFNSTVVTTDDTGYFKLKVEPDSGIYDLFVVPSSAEILVPSVEYPQAFRAETGRCHVTNGEGAEACNLGDLNLGTVATAPLSVSVKLSIPAEFKGEFNWKGTMVLVEGPLGDGLIERKYSVDEDGTVKFSIFPPMDPFLPPDSEDSSGPRPNMPEERAYTLEVVPPADSPFARAKLTIPSDFTTGMLPQIELKQKKQLDGQILAADGSPVAGATLQFQRASEPAPTEKLGGNDAEGNGAGGNGDPSASNNAAEEGEVDPDDPPQIDGPGDGAPENDDDRYGSEDEDASDLRRFSITTDHEGRFQVWLLPAANYQLQVIPSQSSGQPRLNTVLQASTIAQEDTLDLKLPEPTVISGAVFALETSGDAEKLVGMADVGVEAYREIDGKSVVVGQARSNEDGEFKMVLSWEE